MIPKNRDILVPCCPSRSLAHRKVTKYPVLRHPSYIRYTKLWAAITGVEKNTRPPSPTLDAHLPSRRPALGSCSLPSYP